MAAYKGVLYYKCRLCGEIDDMPTHVGCTYVTEGAMLFDIVYTRQQIAHNCKNHIGVGLADLVGGRLLDK